MPCIYLKFMTEINVYDNAHYIFIYFLFVLVSVSLFKGRLI